MFNCSCNLQIESNNANAGAFSSWHFRRFDEFGSTHRSRHLEISLSSTVVLLMEYLHIDRVNRKDGDKIAELCDRSSVVERIKRLVRCSFPLLVVFLKYLNLRLHHFTEKLHINSEMIWSQVETGCSLWAFFDSRQLWRFSVAIDSFLVWTHRQQRLKFVSRFNRYFRIKRSDCVLKPHQL